MNIWVLCFTLMFVSTSVISKVSLPSTKKQYVSVVKLNLKLKRSFKSTTVARLRKGDLVTVFQKKGYWMQVKSGKITGWGLKYSFSRSAPIARASILLNKKNIKLKDVRRRTSAITTAAAARGLAGVSDGVKKDRYLSNDKAVEYMDSFNVSDVVLNKFALPIEQARGL